MDLKGHMQPLLLWLEGLKRPGTALRDHPGPKHHRIEGPVCEHRVFGHAKMNKTIIF